jgi:hypothetical protein
MTLPRGPAIRWTSRAGRPAPPELRHLIVLVTNAEHDGF